MSIEDLYGQLLKWFSAKIDQACEARPTDAPIYRVALARAGEAKPKTRQELEQRSAVMVHELAEWTEMMFPPDRSCAEIQAILHGVPAV